MDHIKQQQIYDKFKELFELSESNFEYIAGTAKNDEHYDQLSDTYSALWWKIEEFWMELFPKRYFFHAESDCYIIETEPKKIYQISNEWVDEISFEEYSKNS